MREHPILFSGPMVRAILDGRKTQTRRVIKPQLPQDATEVVYWWPGTLPDDMSALAGVYYDTPSGLHSQRCPYGELGDELWVRETWAYSTDYDGQVILDHNPLLYRATPVVEPSRWRPSIHMPRTASRLNLRIKRIEAERLQDISEEDARAEGVDQVMHDTGGFTPWDSPCPDVPCYTEAFAELWDSINGKAYPWVSNPWVWAITFSRADP